MTDKPMTQFQLKEKRLEYGRIAIQQLFKPCNGDINNKVVPFRTLIDFCDEFIMCIEEVKLDLELKEEMCNE